MASLFNSEAVQNTVQAHSRRANIGIDAKTLGVIECPAIVAHRSVGWQEREAMRERNLRRSTWLVVMALLAVAALAVWRVIA